MTRRERVIQAITHHATDIVPYSMGFTEMARERTARLLNDDAFESKIGNHIHEAYYSGNPTEVRPGFFKDDFGVVWNRTGVDKDIGVIESKLLPAPDISLYRFPEPPEELLRSVCRDAVANRSDCFLIASIGFSLFERAWTLTSMEDLLAYMLTDADFVHDLMRAITDFNLKVLRIYAEYDFDCFMFGDDWGQQKGLIMGPLCWREFIKPYLTELYAFAKEHGKFIAQHSCGDIEQVFPDLIGIELDIYQTFQPEIYDIQSVKAACGDALSFWGGISTQRLLPFATPEQVTARAGEIMAVMSQNGGYIAAPTHAIPGDVPPENIRALIDLFQNQHR